MPLRANFAIPWFIFITKICILSKDTSMEIRDMWHWMVTRTVTISNVSEEQRSLPVAFLCLDNRQEISFMPLLSKHRSNFCGSRILFDSHAYRRYSDAQEWLDALTGSTILSMMGTPTNHFIIIIIIVYRGFVKTSCCQLKPSEW